MYSYQYACSTLHDSVPLFSYQLHFTVEELLLPLIAVDKMDEAIRLASSPATCQCVPADSETAEATQTYDIGKPVCTYEDLQLVVLGELQTRRNKANVKLASRYSRRVCVCVTVCVSVCV